MKLNKYFDLREFIPKDIYEINGEDSINLIDKRCIYAAYAFRIEFGTISINDWLYGGDVNFRGYRPENCPIGVKRSMHKKGQAVDLVFLDTSIESVKRAVQRDNYYWRYVVGITRIELGTPHLHIDFKETNNDEIEWFHP